MPRIIKIGKRFLPHFDWINVYVYEESRTKSYRKVETAARHLRPKVQTKLILDKSYVAQQGTLLFSFKQKLLQTKRQKKYLKDNIIFRF